MNTNLFGRIYGTNDTSAFNPTWWANETLAILEENMVACNLVNRDFEPYFQQSGDIVNTRRPGEFNAVRKVKTDNITVQDLAATNVAIALDQHIHVSFQVNDLEERSSMADLIQTYISPAGLALARAADRVVLGQYPRFYPNVVGGLGQGTNANDYMLKTLASLKTKLDTQKAYSAGRNLIYTPLTESYHLGSSATYRVNEAGGANQRVNGLVAKTMGLDIYGDQNMADLLLDGSLTYYTGAVVASAGVLAGSVSIPTDGWASAPAVPAAGEWIKVNGFPARVTAVSGTWASAATVMTLTIANALPNGAADNDVITVYKPVLVNLVAGYAAGWNKAIEFDGTGYTPGVGQAVRMGSYVYTVIQRPTATSILLDRSLDAAVVNDSSIFPLPTGSYNFAFHKDALTVAIRPLKPVAAGMGARSATVNFNGLTVRATMGYDMTGQNTIVTLDFLMGVQVLDTNLGCLLLT